jgi:ribosomal protein S18 acetylase RimI-like enzyme
MPSVEIAVARAGEVDAFWQSHERARLREQWNFRVIWHEQTHDLLARAGDEVVGALRARIAASLTHVDALYVVEAYRRQGTGRALLERCEELGNYYNCHKVSIAVPSASQAQRFLEGCGYHLEAVIPQHTFKLDVAMMRKFLL